MPQENVDVVRKAFAAHGPGGIEAALPFFSPNVVWDPGPDWIEDKAYRGREGIRRLNATWLENFDDYALEVHEIRDLQGRVLALYEMTGRTKNTGVLVRQPLGIVCSDFRDGTIGEVRSFLNWREALQAVGLAE